MLNDEKIKELKAMLPAREFMVTGSYALFKYGLIPEKEVMDLDVILIDPTESALEVGKNMMEQFPALTKPRAGTPLLFIFKKEGVKVDVFRSPVVEPHVEINGVKYAIIPNIIEAKKQAGRIKDWIQLRKLSRLFFTPEGFEKYLNGNPKLTPWESYAIDPEKPEEPTKEGIDAVKEGFDNIDEIIKPVKKTRL